MLKLLSRRVGKADVDNGPAVEYQQGASFMVHIFLLKHLARSMLNNGDCHQHRDRAQRIAWSSALMNVTSAIPQDIRKHGRVQSIPQCTVSEL
jgi:hypothetical protein